VNRQDAVKGCPVGNGARLHAAQACSNSRRARCCGSGRRTHLLDSGAGERPDDQQFNRAVGTSKPGLRHLHVRTDWRSGAAFAITVQPAVTPSTRPLTPATPASPRNCRHPHSNCCSRSALDNPFSNLDTTFLASRRRSRYPIGGVQDRYILGPAISCPSFAVATTTIRTSFR